MKNIEYLSTSFQTEKQLGLNRPSVKLTDFVQAYTGLDSLQFNALPENAQQKVYLGLVKMLSLSARIIDESGEEKIQQILGNYFIDPSETPEILTQQIDTLLLGKSDSQLTSQVKLHDELAHFWRILGWEELESYTLKTKSHDGSLTDLEKSCGNLSRTLSLLQEFWSTNGVGPMLLQPVGQIGVNFETNPGFMVIRQTKFPQVTALVNNDNYKWSKDIEYQQQTASSIKASTMLLEKLLAKYPMEFAFALFDYYQFLNKNGADHEYSVSVIQEYKDANGHNKIKGMVKEQDFIILGKDKDGKIHLELTTNMNSLNDRNHDITSFDFASDNFKQLFFIQGDLAKAIHAYEDQAKLIQDLPGRALKNELGKIAKMLGVSNKINLIVEIPLGKAIEPPKLELTGEKIDQIAGEILDYVHEHKITFLSLEAGHLHADRNETDLQRQGLKIGAAISNKLGKVISVLNQPMIDDDHVFNGMDYEEYIKKMKDIGFIPQELIFESSPVVREISMTVLKSLLEKFPKQFIMNGNTLLFNIPNTSLQVECIRDISTSSFEIGCVLFDTALTLYRLFPELANLYSEKSGNEVHLNMLNIYLHEFDSDKRKLLVEQMFSYHTENYDQLNTASVLPELSSLEKKAICNVLEGFYEPQQVKLAGMLKSLGVHATVIGVSMGADKATVKILDTGDDI